MNIAHYKNGCPFLFTCKEFTFLNKYLSAVLVSDVAAEQEFSLQNNTKPAEKSETSLL